MNTPPLPTADNGRDRGGRFTAGNRFANGNPYAKRVAELRSTMLDAVSPENLCSIVKAMIKKAIDGDVAAGREILDRVLGRAVQAHLIATPEDDGQSRDPVDMIRELRSALGVRDDDQAGQAASRAEIVAEQDAIVVIDAKTADHIPVP